MASPEQVRDLEAENAIKLNNKLLGVLITIVLCASTLFYDTLTSLSDDLKLMYAEHMVMGSRVSSIDAKIESLETSKGAQWNAINETKERITRLEERIK